MAMPLCQICGSRPATYVCRSCGRTACGACFDTVQWSCSNCIARTIPPVSEREVVSHSSIATWLFFAAFAMIMIGMLLMTVGSLTGSAGGVSGGAVILIGPIPIILGSGPYSTALIGLAAVLTILALGFYLFMRRKVLR